MRLPALLLSLAACVAPAEVPDEFEIVQIEHAIAGELARTLAQLLSEDPANGTRVIADARTNSLLLSGEPERLEQLAELIARLDVEQ